MLTTLEHWGIWGSALMYFFESMAAPVPIEVPFVLNGQALFSRPDLFWFVVFTTWMASCLGNVVAFSVARKLGRGPVEALARRFGIGTERIDSAADWFRRRGVVAVVVTRWINWGYGISLWAAGFSGAPTLLYLGTVTVNTFIWSIWWTWASMEATRSVVWLGLPPWAVAAPAALVAVVALLVQRRLKRRRP